MLLRAQISRSVRRLQGRMLLFPIGEDRPGRQHGLGPARGPEVFWATARECRQERVLPASVMPGEAAEAGFGYCPAMLSAIGPGRLAGRTRGLLRCGIWAGPVFMATFLAEGAARDGCRSLRHPVSSLALGPRGWVQTANFAVAGMLCLADAAGLLIAWPGAAPGRSWSPPRAPG